MGWDTEGGYGWGGWDTEGGNGWDGIRRERMGYVLLDGLKARKMRYRVRCEWESMLL